MNRYALVSALVLSALSPSTASAGHAVDQPVVDEIAATLAIPATCVYAGQSDVDGAYYASLQTGASGCGNARYLLHRDETGKLALVHSYPDQDEFWCSDYEVPEDIGADLAYCRVVDQRGFTLDLGGDLVFEPRTLGQGAHSLIRKIKWRRWGTARPVGRGTYDYVDQYDRFKVPVEVTLSKRRICGFDTVYLRHTVRFVRKADRSKYKALAGVHTWACSDIKDLGDE